MDIIQERRDAFLDALRTNKFPKINDALHIGDCFCVQGVACEVSGLGEWQNLDNTRYLHYVVEGRLPSATCMPRVVQEYYNFTDEQCSKMMGLNDSEHRYEDTFNTFVNEVAELIWQPTDATSS